jgi:hypothetical protein
VYFSGPGWVAFDPTQPGAGGAAADAGPDVREPVGPDPRTPAPPTLAAPPTSPPQTAPAPSGSNASTTLTVLVAGGTVFLVVLVLSVARGSRRLRHRRAGPCGAWSELLDLLVLLGKPPARWRTTTGIAADLAAAVPEAAPGVFRLAEYADRAAFAPPPVPATRRLGGAAPDTPGAPPGGAVVPPSHVVPGPAPVASPPEAPWDRTANRNTVL